MAPSKGLFSRISNFDLTTLFQPAPPPSTARSIFINTDLPDSQYKERSSKWWKRNTSHRKVKKENIYTTNQVITSKYTVFTFLPRNLLEQFRRIANIFFAGIAILQFFPKFSTISPGLVLLPLIVVLLVSAIKDGYEDIKRHQSDRRVNHSVVKVLADGDWSNPNVSAGKEKTFTRGVSLPFRRRIKNKDVEKTEKDPEAAEPPTVEVSSVDSDNEPETEGGPYWKPTLWEDIKVGDVVKIYSDQQVPADLLLCTTSEDENVAFVETKNLDGETNLKSRNGVAALSHWRTAKDCAQREGNAWQIDAEAPSVNMYKLSAAVVPLKSEARKEPVNLQTCLLRGTVLRNTRWAIGIVLYTGRDTKIVMNSGGTPSKRSKVERQMNPMVFINLMLLAVMATVCAIVDSVLQTRYFREGALWMWGADRSDDNPRINGLVTFANALITFQNVIPISLYISIEFVRTCQALFIYFDHQIWYEKTDTATLARSWNLADDLGQVQFLVSDKTGTLTQNVMVFRQCSIGGKIYKGEEDAQPKPASPTSNVPSSDSSTPVLDTSVPHFRDATLTADIDAAMTDSSHHARVLNGFFATLALCHSVLASVDPKSGEIRYKAQSPDEQALVQAAADVGFIFRGRDREILQLQTPFADHVERYELLHMLDFTSARKRMSVVVRKLEEDDRRVFLLVKGADSVIFERLKPGADELRESTENHLEYFANEGLRTLCLAYKVIPDEEYEEWAKRYHEATVAIEDREEKIEAVSDEIERNLRLLGATAIEDKLQDGVPETIADLKAAGIKVWVATGDKLETAIAIGYTTNLVAKDSNLIIIRGGEFGKSHSAYEQMQRAAEQFFPEQHILENDTVQAPELEDPPRTPTSPRGPNFLRRTNTGLSSIVSENNGRKPGGYVLVIDGTALGHAFEEEFSKNLLLQLSLRCEAVICCRVSPLQKALLVRMIKDGLGVMTLAIGDGANDVSMIQAADVGVGISGEEGLQAVNSSDYAIAQFRFLKRLLFVHGHWSYARNSNMIVNFFYKNIVCIGVLWWFQIYCGWSTTYVFEYTYLLFWNVFWSLAPVIAIGIFDRNIDADILMDLPQLYRYGREGRWFGSKVFLIYMLDGVFQSAVIFFLTFYAYWSTTARKDGLDIPMYEFSTTMVIASVMAVNFFNGLNTHAWTGWVFFAVSIGVILVWAYTAIYSLISPGWFVTPSYGLYWFLFRSAYFWFCIPLTFLLAMLPRYLAKAAKFIYWPDDVDVMRWLRKTNPGLDIANDPRLGGRFKARYEEDPSSRRHSVDADEDQPTDLPRRSMQSARPSMETRGSRTDMSTGVRSTSHRGFDFSAEEGGVAIRRMQSNLSERTRARLAESGQLPAASRTKPRSGSLSLFPGLRRSVGRRKGSGLVLSQSPPR